MFFIGAKRLVPRPGMPMPNWTLKQLETFVWVAKLGSFRGTAERLNTTQPNVSVRIAELETALGARLFDRDAGSVTLTPVGHSLLVYAERVLVATEEFAAKAGRADQQTGILRLGVTELVAHSWLRTYLRTLKREFPQIDVELKVDLSFNLRSDLVSRSLDICLLNGPISDFNISNVDLRLVSLVWVASPALTITGSGLAALATHTILTHARNTRPYVELAAHFREFWDGPVRIVPSSSLAACLQMTIEGLGIATLPEPLVRNSIASGELVPLDYEWTPSPLIFTASFAHSPASMLVKRAAAIARECIGGDDDNAARGPVTTETT